jgi:hypothetical protein
MNAGPGRNSLDEYQGIWLAGMTSVSVATVAGGLMYMTLRSRAVSPVVASSAARP